LDRRPNSNIAVATATNQHSLSAYSVEKLG